MKRKKGLYIFLAVELVVCLLLAITTRGGGSSGYSSLMKFPLAQLANILRSLSLSSQLGNMIALILYILIGLLPLVYLAYRHYKKKKSIEDIILLPMPSALHDTLFDDKSKSYQ